MYTVSSPFLFRDRSSRVTVSSMVNANFGWPKPCRLAPLLPRCCSSHCLSCCLNFGVICVGNTFGNFHPPHDSSHSVDSLSMSVSHSVKWLRSSLPLIVCYPLWIISCSSINRYGICVHSYEMSYFANISLNFHQIHLKTMALYSRQTALSNNISTIKFHRVPTTSHDVDCHHHTRARVTCDRCDIVWVDKK
jgi:hypothetical protein